MHHVCTHAVLSCQIVLDCRCIWTEGWVCMCNAAVQHQLHMISFTMHCLDFDCDVFDIQKACQPLAYNLCVCVCVVSEVELWAHRGALRSGTSEFAMSFCGQSKDNRKILQHSVLWACTQASQALSQCVYDYIIQWSACTDIRQLKQRLVHLFTSRWCDTQYMVASFWNDHCPWWFASKSYWMSRMRDV